MKLIAILLLFNLAAQSQNVFIHGTVSNYSDDVVPFYKKDYTTSTDIHIPVKSLKIIITNSVSTIRNHNYLNCS